MKKWAVNFLFLLVFISLTGCWKSIMEDMVSPNPPVPAIPEATQEGKHTFGCYLDGKDWVSRIQYKLIRVMCFGCSTSDSLQVRVTRYQYSQSNTGKYIIKIYAPLVDDFRKISQSISFSVLLDTLLPGSYPLTKRSESEVYFYDAAFQCATNLEPELDSVGVISFSRIDTVSKIVSGNFEFAYPKRGTCRAVTATNGRFDLRY